MNPHAPATAMGRRPTPAMGDNTMGIHPNQISSPPWAILGYRADGRPIRPLAGGSEDGDAPDADTEVDDAPTEDIDPDPEVEAEAKDDTPKPKPPAKKAEPKSDEDYVPTAAEWRRTQEALKKANVDAKRNRERARELEEQGRANETEHEKALREAREEGERRFREPMKRAGVKAALAEAGFGSPDRLLKLVDWDALSVDDDGDVLGVEAEVERLKSDYPELLPQAAPKPKPRPTAAPRAAAPEKPKTSWEQHAQRILGRA